MTDSAWNAYQFNKGVDAAIDTLRDELNESQLSRLVACKRRITVDVQHVTQYITKQGVKGEE